MPEQVETQSTATQEGRERGAADCRANIYRPLLAETVEGYDDGWDEAFFSKKRKGLGNGL